MTIDRVASNAQTQLMLSQIMQASSNLDNTEAQVASGLVSQTYAGIGSKTAVLEAAQAAASQATAYQSNTQLAVTQADLQNTQLTELGNLSAQLQQAMQGAIANNDGTGLNAQVQNIFDQAVQILNSQDSNGNYIYGGTNDNSPPVTVTSLSQLASTPIANVFANSTQAKSVNVGNGQSVTVGVLASQIGTQLMQTLQDIANFNAGPNGNFGAGLSQAQSNFLTSELAPAQAATQSLNSAAAANGYTYNQLQDAVTQQQSLSTLYTGFVSNIQNVDMGTAITNLNQDQTALEAALKVTAQLNSISLLNDLPAPTS